MLCANQATLAGAIPENAMSGLVLIDAPRSPEAEAYRTLRTNVQFSGVDRPIKVIAVTSAGAGEGKSTTLANLALALAETGARVVVVDADLRRPALHTLFGLSNEDGLSNAILHPDRPLPLRSGGRDTVQVLTSGPVPPNPAELIGSPRLDDILARLREQAEYVVVDTPPVTGLSDTATLAPRVDGVVLVVGAGVTRRDLARRAKEQLERVHARVLGVVLTGVKAEASVYDNT